MERQPRVYGHPGAKSPERWRWCVGQSDGPKWLKVPPGTDLYESLERWVADRGYDGAAFRLIHGVAGELDLMTGKPDSQSGRVATFHGPHHITCPARILGGHGAIGGGRDGFALHSHAIFVDAAGVARGCHLVRGRCVASEEGIDLAIFPYEHARFRVRPDPETRFELFYPEPVMTNAAPERATPANRVVLVKLQPNQDIYAGLEGACREAGLSKGLVLSGVGSLNEAWFEGDGTSVRVIEGPGLEIAGVTGWVDAAHKYGGVRETALTAWSTRADGTVAGGVLARRGNIVCITFEFTVMAMTSSGPANE